MTKRLAYEVEEKFRTYQFMVESAYDAIFFKDLESRYIIANNKTLEAFGLSREDVIGKNDYELMPDKKEANKNVDDDQIVFKSAKPKEFTKHMTGEDGKEYWFQAMKVPRFDNNGKVIGLVGVARDITKRKQAENALKTSLKVKQMLLSEIQHRVKNNFEVISSLIELTFMNTENLEAQKLLSDLSSRIHSMALIHNQIYQNNRFEKVDMEKYVHEIVNHISNIYGSSEKLINFIIEATEMYLYLNQAIPLALALNEIITNSFKHAFRDNKKGTINICINNPADDTVFIRVKDDGVGISKGIDFNNTKGLGLMLVKHLIEDQLKGEIRINGDGGTEISIEFKKFKL